MEAYLTTPFQSEMHYQMQVQGFNHKLSPTAEKIIQLCPEIVLGQSNLFHYDQMSRGLILSSPFKSLLTLLVKLEELDAKALTVNSLYDLNSVFQKPQGIGGGLLRKEGTERWHLEDNSNKQKYSQVFDLLLQQLGFVSAKPIEHEVVVDHCIVFGALTKRMEDRIKETLTYLRSSLKAEHIILLGSNRKLIPSEIEHVKGLLESMDESDQNYWNAVFNDPEQSTEANAFAFLWKCLVPKDQQPLLENKLLYIKSTRIGNSYHERSGHRVTTEVTIEDWMPFFKSDRPQNVFAIAEQPYIRLADQLRFTVLSNGKKADLNGLIERINNTTFHFAAPKPVSEPLISVMLDEIARNVYRTVDALKYLEGLD